MKMAEPFWHENRIRGFHQGEHVTKRYHLCFIRTTNDRRAVEYKA
jgi:hypothetical protein